MKRFTLIGGMAAVALSAAAHAQPVANNAVSVVASRGGDKVRTFGPDRDNRYTLEVVVSDLNLATAKGTNAMRSRVRLGAAILCEVSAEGPQIAGYYDGAARRCASDTMVAAERQMASARQATADGRPIARLELTSAVELH